MREMGELGLVTDNWLLGRRWERRGVEIALGNHVSFEFLSMEKERGREALLITSFRSQHLKPFPLSLFPLDEYSTPMHQPGTRDVFTRMALDVPINRVLGISDHAQRPSGA